MRASVADSERPRPQIIENYHDFTPPKWLKGVIQDALDSVPANYLAGLKIIVLANKSALTRDQRRKRVWQQGRKHRLAEARGCYYPSTRSRPASIWIYADNILRPLPHWFVRLPICAVMVVADVLFHEVGHHIHNVHQPVYQGKENVADYWAKKLSRAFGRRRYWYAMPLLYPVGTGVNLVRKIKKKLFPKLQRSR